MVLGDNLLLDSVSMVDQALGKRTYYYTDTEALDKLTILDEVDMGLVVQKCRFWLKDSVKRHTPLPLKYNLKQVTAGLSGIQYVD